jgi:hypothetical protein
MPLSFAWMPVTPNNPYGRMLGLDDQVTLPFAVTEEADDGQEDACAELTPHGLLVGVVCELGALHAPDDEPPEAVRAMAPRIVEVLAEGFHYETPQDAVLSVIMMLAEEEHHHLAVQAARFGARTYPDDARFRADFIMACFGLYTADCTAVGPGIMAEIRDHYDRLDFDALKPDSIPQIEYMADRAREVE